MPDISPALMVFASAFAGALISSFAGFAFAPVAGVILLAAYAPDAAIPALMVCSILVQLSTLTYLRRSLAFGTTGMMLVGGALGVPLAIMLFSSINARALEIVFGLFLAVYATVMLLRPFARLRMECSPGRDVAVGFMGGFIGGLTAMPGAMPVLYCDCRGVTKEVQRATVQPFILAMQVLALVMMGLHGKLNAQVGELVLMALPGLAAGVVMGLVLFGRVPDAGFRRVVLVLLLATGLGLAGKASAKSASTPSSSEPTQLSSWRFSEIRGAASL